MATRSITIALEAKVSGLVAGFKTAQQAANDFGSRTQEFAEKNRASLEAVGQTGMVAGGALVAGFGLAVTKFASFDKAMSSVQAATHESTANMELLREAAIRAGADTAFSAEESAQAIEEMAKAGVSTADILGGGLDGALALAAAGALDVGEAAETAASAMTQFGLSGSDIPHIADLLAAGAGKAQGSVRDLGMALNQSGLVAAQTGLSIEEATGGLAAFAAAGLVGSDAGTSFKTMLQRLTPSSQNAVGTMDELGISAYDAQGNFIGLAAFAENLQTSMKDLTVEQRNAAMSTIFGSDAVRAAAVMYEQGAEGVQGWIDAVNDAGYAAETAALMQDNLAGDLEKLGGAMDTVFLQAGSGANDALRGLVQTAEDFVDAIGRIPGPILSTMGVLGGMTGGALLLGGAFLSLAPRVFETIGHFKALKVEAEGAYNKLTNVGKAAGIAAAAFVGFQILKEINNEVWAPTSQGLEEIANAMVGASRSTDRLDEAFRNADWANGNSRSLMQGTIEGVDGIGSALGRIENKSWNETFSSWGNGLLGFKDKWQALNEDLAAVDTTLAGYVSSGNAESAAAAFKQIANDAEASGGSIQGAAEKFPEYLDSLRKMATSAGVALDEQELLNWAMGETPPAMVAAAASSDETAAALGSMGDEAEEVVMSLEDIVEALFLLGEITMSSRDSTAAFHESLRAMNEVAAAAANGTLGLGAVLNETATDFDLTTEAGAKANAAFQDVARKGMADVEAKAKEGMGQPELQANLRGTYDSLITALGGLNITGTAAETLARKVLGVPDNVDIETWMSDAALRLAQNTGAELDKLDGRKINIYETTHKEVVMTERNERVGVGQVGRYAVGGAVLGPGTTTSDSIPALLSNGEHVLDAVDVQRMGGQSAVYRFRDQLKAGVPGYAGGGRVGREYSAPAAMIMAPASREGSGGSKTVIVRYEGPDIDALTTAVARRLN